MVVTPRLLIVGQTRVQRHGLSKDLMTPTQSSCLTYSLSSHMSWQLVLIELGPIGPRGSVVRISTKVDSCIEKE